MNSWMKKIFIRNEKQSSSRRISKRKILIYEYIIYEGSLLSPIDQKEVFLNMRGSVQIHI